MFFVLFFWHFIFGEDNLKFDNFQGCVTCCTVQFWQFTTQAKIYLKRRRKQLPTILPFWNEKDDSRQSAKIPARKWAEK